uniref:ATP synthase F0 subunit 8 n=1 Tax=Gononemertes parasita TaxID=649615 RepID=A0A075CG87_9BILA|nr:ATP synthase F0 subunit 8 [Gononemertes parasita]AGZ63899.1 ATP synthase F0 subunit 8 [Gononemertes parasita]
MPQISPISWLVLPSFFFVFFFCFLFCLWWCFFSFFLFSVKVCLNGNLVVTFNFWDW